MRHEKLGSDVLTRKGRPIKFTPERIQQIRNLVERGTSRELIAELLDVTLGSLQVTCSRLGISLRRPIFSTGTGLRRSGSRYSNGRAIRDAIAIGTTSMLPTEPIANEQSPQSAERGQAVGMDEASHARFAFTVQYNGQRRSTELPLTQDMIRKIAFEAQFRDIQMGQLLGELITATMTKDLFELVLDGEQTAESHILLGSEVQVFPS